MCFCIKIWQVILFVYLLLLSSTINGCLSKVKEYSYFEKIPCKQRRNKYKRNMYIVSVKIDKDKCNFIRSRIKTKYVIQYMVQEIEIVYKSLIFKI